MILGIDSDLVDIRRIEKTIARHSDRFLVRVFTDVERAKAEKRAWAALREMRRVLKPDGKQRIAVPMIGGMVSSTLLTLVVIPAIYAVVKGFAIRTSRLGPALQQP